MNHSFFTKNHLAGICTLLFLLTLPALCHAECRLISVKPVETEVGIIGADIMVEGTPDVGRTSLDNRQVVLLKDCSCDKGSFSIKADGRFLEQIRWSYHEDKNRVYVVFDLAQKAAPHITNLDGRIRVLFSDAPIASNLSPQPSPPPVEDALTSEPPKGKDGLQPFHGTAGPIPPNVEAMIKMYSWREGCPVPIPKLWLLQVTYYGYDGKDHQGRIIVNKSVAWEMVDIFRDLYKARFPVQRLELIDEYKGDDLASMADNNTSAFNCRMATGSNSTYSKHAFGLAVDINPLVNPYVKGNSILPEQGREYADRSIKKKGMIFKGDAAYRAFTKRGWVWGGSWKDLKDYQHFEKQ